MSLGVLRLHNFRLFSDETIPLVNRSVIIGANGSGKSTLIEALRLLSVGKSFRTNRLDETIHFDEPFFRLTLNKESVDGKQPTVIDLFYGQAFATQPTKDRVLTVNGKTIQPIEYIGTLPTVLFVPGDIEIVMGMPSLRRRYLDGVLWQEDPEFRHQYLEISRVLKERSALLFLLKIKRAGLDELRPWNELLEGLTMTLRQKRQQYCQAISEGLLDSNFTKNSPLTFTVKYRYSQSSLADLQQQEIESSQNLYGPHRDELEIIINDRSARKFASRGQARSVVVLLKAIEAKYLADRLATAPIILLDDVLSELDETNAKLLFDCLPPASPVVATAITEHPLFDGWEKKEL